MKGRPRKDTIEEVAGLMGLEPAYVEKDWFVTQIILLLSNADFGEFKLVFTGGTALSKAHCLIKRFSEDIDYKVLVTKPTRSRLSKFKENITEYLRKNDFHIPKEHKPKNKNQCFIIEIDYTTYFKKNDALRNHIQIDINVKELQLPHIDKPVSSLINYHSTQPPEVMKVACSDPLENAADKLSAITWRIPNRNRGKEKPDERSLVRHIHDLAALEKIIKEDYSKFSSLVTKALESDKNYYKKNQAFASLTEEEKFNSMLNILDTDKEYPNEYATYVKGMSYDSNDSIPKYETAIQTVKTLVKKVLSSK